MKRLLAAIGLGLLSSGSATAKLHFCNGTYCPVEVRIAAVAEGKVHGLLVSATKVGCRRVRYRVETQGLRRLGTTPAPAAGEATVVRIGNGFATWAHVILVSAEGCATEPHLSRRVALRKTSADHCWRAALDEAALQRLR